MGLLDKIIEDQAAVEAAKLQKEQERLSQKELESRKKESFKQKSIPLIRQALDEFPEACRKSGIDPLPLVVRKKKTLFSSRDYSCLLGYYLIPSFDRWYEVFMTEDGRFFVQMKEIQYSDGSYKTRTEKKRYSISACWSTDSDVVRQNSGNEKYKLNSPVRLYEEIAGEEVQDFVAQNIIEKAYTMTENDNYAYREIHDAFEADDSEKAVLSIFSFFMRANSRDRDILLRNEDLCEFYRGLEKD